MLGPYGQWIPGTWPCHALRQEDCVPSLGACRDVDIRWSTATKSVDVDVFPISSGALTKTLRRKMWAVPQMHTSQAIPVRSSDCETLAEPLVVHRSKVIWNRRTSCWSLVRVKKIQEVPPIVVELEGSSIPEAAAVSLHTRALRACATWTYSLFVSCNVYISELRYEGKTSLGDAKVRLALVFSEQGAKMYQQHPWFWSALNN